MVKGTISVIIPAYNASTYLHKTLKSVFEQTMLPHEVIVVDDGSTDDTALIARSFSQGISQSYGYSIKVISVPNGGVSAARNIGVDAATGEYIAFLDADDIWMPTKLAVQLEAIKSFNTVFSYTDYKMFNENGIFKGKTELKKRWAFLKTAGKIKPHQNIIITTANNKPVQYSSYISPSTIMVRREDYLTIKGFNKNLSIAEDFEFCSRLFKLVSTAVVIMKPLTLYRQHNEQATSNGPRMKEELLNVICMMISSPKKYPPADVDYFIKTKYLQYHIIGMSQARLGQFDKAIKNFSNSITIHWTLRTNIALIAAQLCQSTIGRFVFNTIRMLWKKRPGK